MGKDEAGWDDGDVGFQRLKEFISWSVLLVVSCGVRGLIENEDGGEGKTHRHHKYAKDAEHELCGANDVDEESELIAQDHDGEAQ